MIHRLASGLVVEMVVADESDDRAQNYGVYLSDAAGQIMSWTGDEWIEDPRVVASIVNAVAVGAHSVLLLRRLLKLAEVPISEFPLSN